MSDLTGGSLFAGIGGFGVAMERAEIKVKWQVEIDGDCIRVLERHWPAVARHRDIREVGAHNLEPVDIITGGTPCQDLSVAGRRAGLDGERSGLFFEFVRVIKEMQPEWFVWENVPGALSSNDGRDMAVVLDAFEDLGYIPDVNILDAQFFGVPQRRRRVFAICQRSESLREQRTTTSALTFAQCLTEILLSILVGARHRSLSGYANSISSKFTSADGLQRRMRSFGLNQSENWKIWCEHLGDERATSCTTSANSGFQHVVSAEATGSTETAMPSEIFPESMASGFDGRSIGLSWKTCWEEVSELARSSTTSMETSSITEERIYTCSQTLLHIASLICQSNPSCPAYWSAASSVSIALKEYTNYARQASSSLFGDVAWVHPWLDFIGEADGANDALLSAGVSSRGEILPLSESVQRNSPPSREAGQGVAAGATAGVAAGRGVNRPGRRQEDDINLVAGPLLGGHAGGHRIGADEAAGGQLVVHPILEAGARQGTKADKRDGIGIGEPDDPMFTLQAGKQHGIAVLPFDTTQVTSDKNYSQPREGAPCHPLAAGAHPPAIAFTERTRDGQKQIEWQEGTAYSLNNPGEGGRADERCVAYPLEYNGVGGLNNVDATEARPREVLRVLQQAAGPQAFEQWFIGRLDELQEAQVLRSGVHGEELRPEALAGGTVVGSTQVGETTDSEGAMREVWVAESVRRASQRWQLAQQHDRELGAYLSELSQPGAPQTQALHDLWEAAEGLGLLRHALSAIQDAWRPADSRWTQEDGLHNPGVRSDGERQGTVRTPLHATQESQDSVGTLACNTGPNGHDAGNFASNQGVDAGFVRPEKGVAGWGVRRLTPL